MDDLNYEDFLIDLRQLLNKMQKEMNDDLKKWNITSTHVGILMILKKKENGYSMTELSRLTKVDNALMTRNIKELEKINYIYRNRENEMQRKYHICLTKEGKQVAKEIQEIIEEAKRNFQNMFEKEELDIIEKAYQIMIQKLKIKIEKEEK